MIGFRPAVERAEKVHPGPADVELVEMAAAAGGQKGNQAVAGNADLFARVEIEVVGVDLHPARGAAASGFEQRVGGDQMVVDGVPQMGQIKSAEGAVPIRAVALSAIQLAPRLVEEMGPLDGLLFRGDLLQALADLQHAGVHLVGFGVFDAEIAPRAAADEGPQGGPIGVLLFAFGDVLEFDQPFDGERPLGHFAVAGIGKVDAADGGHVIDRLAQRADFEPIGVLAERVEEPLEPAVLVDVLLGSGPGAELLSVVAEADDGRGDAVGNLAEIADRLLRLGEGDRVTELLAAGKNLQQPAFILGEVIAVKLLVAEAGTFEVMVVEDGVFDSRAGDVGGEVLLPDALGHPHAADLGAEELLQVARVRRDLADAVEGGNSRQDRLVEGPADDLDLAAFGECPQGIDIFAVSVDQPFQQAAGDVKRNGDLSILLQGFRGTGA